MTDWRELAAEKRIEDAVLAYIVERDHVTFTEIQQSFEPFMVTTGEVAMTAKDRPNAVFWVGLSDGLFHVLGDLLASERVHLVPSQPLIYMIDGGMLRLPVARRAPAGGADWKQPHWLVCVFRPGKNPPPRRVRQRRSVTP